MTSQRILIIGATSAVAQGIAQRFAQEGARIFCLARNPEKTEAVATSLGSAFAGSFCYDFTQTDLASEAITKATAALGSIDIALIAHGELLDQIESEHDYAVAYQTFAINQLSVIALLIPLAEQMEQQGCGKIGVITSVAGERGRPRNYTYGAAKGSLNIYLQGLRSTLWGSGVEIYTFKMGPVDTPMTIDHEKNFSFSTVEQVSKIIVKGFESKRYERYVPGYWRFVMFFVRNMPEWLFQQVGFLSGR
ncbi:MAG: SDR family NAD(P)-dependent oxidoreductase [Anaerolineae bacterium]|nr:SDR family NAD(P)-dependent oxidoreductase [Anaerolineae bacterium]